MSELVVEIGCEELPASSLLSACADLRDGIARRLTEAGLPGFSVYDLLYTPRRLIVGFDGLPGEQPPQNVEARGPSVTAAYDAEGNPTKALEGFCRGQGVDPSDAESDGQYVWVRKTLPGQATNVLLSSLVPDAVADIRFAKTMRWANGTFRFARPIRWIVSLFDGEVVPFSVAGVPSGAESRGHRFISPAKFTVTSYAQLVSELVARSVQPCPKKRQDGIRVQLTEFGLDPGSEQNLIDENANLTEWPQALIGEFNSDFLVLPDPVLKTVMAKHERFFPVRGSDGRLINKFVSVRNGGQESDVREGNRWVLNARFNDAKFFYEDDLKHSLDHFLEKTSAMNFHDRLGTIRDRCARLESLVKSVALWSGTGAEDADCLALAGRFAKADLTTGLVSELDELQGVIGGEYALREGMPQLVSSAISDHYRADKLALDNPGSQAAAIVMLADQIDKLAGFVGTGSVPTGSSDPFGLRRSATQIIEIVWNWPKPLPSLSPMFEKAAALYRHQGVDISEATAVLQEIFAARYESLLGESKALVDVVTFSDLDPRATRFRMDTMRQIIQDATFVQTCTRPANIVAAALKKGIGFFDSSTEGARLQSTEGESLRDVVLRQSPVAHKAAQAEDSDGLIAALKPLAEPINAFFDSTMVMVEDDAVRDARLKMLDGCVALLRLAGDFTKVETA